MLQFHYVLIVKFYNLFIGRFLEFVSCFSNFVEFSACVYGGDAGVGGVGKKENVAETYGKLKDEYFTIKALLCISGGNFTDIDKIKE